VANADIEATITRLDRAVAQTRARNPRLGLFAAMYRQTTVAVGRGWTPAPSTTATAWAASSPALPAGTWTLSRP
jgi:hypothetical protein